MYLMTFLKWKAKPSLAVLIHPKLPCISIHIFEKLAVIIHETVPDLDIAFGMLWIVYIFPVFRTGVQTVVHVQPSEPKYYQYNFPEGEDSVVVKATSEDDLCMVLSVQQLHVC